MEANESRREIMKKEDFYNTKWNVGDWTEDQKVRWQQACFGMGFHWCGENRIQCLNASCYFLYNTEETITQLLTYHPIKFIKHTNEEKHFHDMFPEEVPTSEN